MSADEPPGKEEEQVESELPFQGNYDPMEDGEDGPHVDHESVHELDPEGDVRVVVKESVDGLEPLMGFVLNAFDFCNWLLSAGVYEEVAGDDANRDSHHREHVFEPLPTLALDSDAL